MSQGQLALQQTELLQGRGRRGRQLKHKVTTTLKKGFLFEMVAYKEDIFLKKHRNPPSSSIAATFPCLYNCNVGSGQLYRHTATAVYI